MRVFLFADKLWLPQTQPFLYGVEDISDNGISALSTDSGSHILATSV
jgi:hypothetical protein